MTELKALQLQVRRMADKKRSMADKLKGLHRQLAQSQARVKELEGVIDTIPPEILEEHALLAVFAEAAEAAEAAKGDA